MPIDTRTGRSIGGGPEEDKKKPPDIIQRILHAPSNIPRPASVIKSAAEQVERVFPLTSMRAQAVRYGLQRLPGRPENLPKVSGGDILKTPLRVMAGEEKASFLADPVAEAIQERGMDTPVTVPGPFGSLVSVKPSTAIRAAGLFEPTPETGLRLFQKSAKGIKKFAEAPEEFAKGAGALKTALGPKVAAERERLSELLLKKKARGAQRAEKGVLGVLENIKAAKAAGVPETELVRLSEDARAKALKIPTPNLASEGAIEGGLARARMGGDLTPGMLLKGTEAPEKGKAFQALLKTDRASGIRLGKRAARDPIAEHQAAMQELFSTVGPAANYGEAAKRGEVDLAHIDLPFGKKATIPGRPVTQALSGAGRFVRQGLADVSGGSILEPIGKGTATPMQAFRSGMEGTRLPGEIGQFGREMSKFQWRQQAGEQRVFEQHFRKRLHDILSKGKPLNEDEFKALHGALDTYRKSEMVPVEFRPTGNENIDTKGLAIRKMLDDLNSIAKGEGLDVGYLTGYFPRPMTPAYHKFQGITNPTDYTILFGRSGGNKGFMQGRQVTADMGAEEFNQLFRRQHPDFVSRTGKPLDAIGTDVRKVLMGHVRGHAAATTYPKALDQVLGYAGRKIRTMHDLRPGEVMVIAPGSLRDIGNKLVSDNSQLAKAYLNVAANGSVVDFMGVTPHLTNELATSLQQVAQNGAKLYAVPADVAKDMKTFTKRLSEDMGELPMLYRSAMQTLKQNILVPFASWHEDNYLGNLSLWWMRGMPLSEINKHGGPVASILHSGMFGKGLDTSHTFLGETKTTQEWLKEWESVGVSKGGVIGSMTRGTSPELLGLPRSHVGDLPSYIPPYLTAGIPIPTFRPGLKGAQRFEHAGYLRAGRAVAGLLENQPRIVGYLWGRSRGMSVAQARELVSNTSFDYDEVSKIVSKLRTGAVPFLTWTFKALPFVMKRMIQHPASLPFTMPTRIQHALREENKVPPNESDFTASTNAFPIGRGKEGDIYSARVGTVQAEPAKFAPTPPRPTADLPQRLMGGLVQGGLSSLGPLEQTAMKIVGVNPLTGEPLTNKDVEFVQRGPVTVPRYVDTFLSIWRPYAHFWGTMDSARDMPWWMKATNLSNVARISRSNPEDDAQMRQYRAHKALSDLQKKLRSAETEGRVKALEKSLDKAEGRYDRMYP
jgi:hypothetical protein